MTYNYSRIDKKVEGIIKKVCLYMRDLDPEYVRWEIENAYLYARDAHEGDFRKSWEPYIIHPVEAVEFLLSIKPDIQSIQACFLHDVIEDTSKTEEDIEKEFWKEVASICIGLTKLSKVRYKWEEREVGSLRKMFIAMAEDLRVVFIKLADRLHNMKTLKYHPKAEKREKIALETLNIYAPIADRLWLYHFKNDLEEECFKTLDPKKYRDLKKQLKEMEQSSNAFVKSAKEEIHKILKWEVENYEIDYRVKSIYSIYKKLTKKSLHHISALHDLFGIRIIVNDVATCYRVLGLVHNKWKPIPNRFKDYIALPKPNGYKSIHTTIVWLLKEHRKLPTEIQIKTFEMKEYSDIWVAAHFEYKEKGSSISTDVDWVKELKELTQNLWDSDLLWSLKVDVFKHRIFVFTPNGDSINLPSGSTPVDFAYYVHTDLWNHISAAKVNGNIYPLDKELHNGDMVEILIDKNKRPNPFWMSFLKTVKAKNAVKAYLKEENKELHRERGREIMNRYLEKAGIWKFDKDLSFLKVIDGREYNLEDRLRLLEQVGNFSITPWVLMRRIIKSNKISLDGKNKAVINKNVFDESWEEKKKKYNIIIGWEPWIDYKQCRCCRRKIPDEIVAHINNKWVVTIHRRDCKILIDVNKERLLSAYIEWSEEERLVFHLNLIFKNKIWVLKKLSETLFSMEMDVDEIVSKKLWSKKTSLDLQLVIPNYDYLLIDRLIDRLKLTFDGDLLEYEVEKID